MALNNDSTDKRMEARGNLEEKAKLLKLADDVKRQRIAKDIEDIKFDVKTDLEGDILELYDKMKLPGETVPEFLERVPIDKLLRIELSDGGKVIPLSQYMKIKEKPKIKKIDLAQGDYSKLVSDLTDNDKLLIKELLRKSGVIVGDK